MRRRQANDIFKFIKFIYSAETNATSNDQVTKIMPSRDIVKTNKNPPATFMCFCVHYYTWTKKTNIKEEGKK